MADLQPYPCPCNYACKGSWSLAQNQFCRWNNPARSVDWEREHGDAKQVQHDGEHTK